MTAAWAPTGRTVVRTAAAVILVLTLVGSAAWAFWTTDSAPGGNGASAAAVVDQGSKPSASASERTVTVSWAPTTLSTGDPVTGYLVRRYDAATLTLQSIGTGCSGTLTTTTCAETRVPAGQWVYAVTPVVGTNWRGQESVRSAPVTVAAPSLTLSTTRVRPGTSMTGTAAGFLSGDTLRYRLDSPAGTELTGTLAGTATPTTVPASGGGAVNVTVPAGTADGSHTIYAVASPSGDAGVADIVVDGTPPPVPVLTLTPTATSGDSVTFAFSEAEASATVECRLDSAAFAPCQSPVEYSGLAAGSHTFQARAVDTVGNVSALTSYTWTVSLSVPTVSIGFPLFGGAYNDSGFTAGCATAATGDVCGSADDDLLVVAVAVSLRRSSTGLYWNGSSFSAASETFLNATGTTDWSYGISPASLPEGDYTVRARATDATTNVGFDTRTFTIDRTAPAVPTLTTVPPNPSGSTTSVGFTTTDPTAGFQCSLDAGAWSACSTPQQYAGLTDGSHTVSVRAVDPAGNTSAAASTTWTVDATAPTAVMSFPTAARLNLAGWTAGCGTPATGDICGTSADAGSGIARVEVSIRRASTNSYWDGAGFAASIETWHLATGTTSWSYAFAGTSFPADGGYTVRWRAVDAAGNTTTGGVDLVVDTTAPAAPTIVQAPPDPSGPTVQFDFNAEAQAQAECRMDALAWTPCTAPVAYADLAAGSHTFAVRATDLAGNTGTPASYTWTVDVGLPSVSVSFPSAGRTYNDAGFADGCGTPAGDLCGTAADPQGNLARVDVSIQRQSTSLFWDGTGFASPTEVYLPATGTQAWSYPIAAAAFPAEGDYTVRARATDGVGLTAVDTVTMTIDRTPPPAPTITSGPTGTTGATGTFTFTGQAGAVFECRLDTGAWLTCTSPRSVSGLTDGSHTFDVRAVDQAGNTGPATSRTWTVDTAGPAVASTFPTAGGVYNNTTFDAGCVAGTGDICGTSSDAGSGVATVQISLQRASTGLYLSGTTFGSGSQNWITATGTTAWTYPLAAATFPANDTYVLAVRATDVVGNTTTTTTSFRIDRTVPTVTGLTTTNVSGGLTSRLDAGDTFSLTFSDAMAPGSILAGWSGTTVQNVVVRATGNGGAKDKLVVYNATNTTLLPLGTLNLKRSDYVAGAMTFGLTGTASTLSMSGTTVTIKLGTPSGVPTLAAAAANITWTPDTGATDLAGNAVATTAYTEGDNDRDF
jgi:hypothetical protein